MNRLARVLLIAAFSWSCGGSTPVPDSGTPTQAAFEATTLSATLGMGYALQAPVTLRGGSDVRRVAAKVEQVPDDLEVGFVGAGSQDEPVLLGAGETATVQISVTGVNATKRSYALPVGLYAVPGEGVAEESWVRVATATFSLALREPNVQLSVTLLSTDPATLAQTFQLKNQGDPVDGLDVRVEGRLGILSTLRPEMQQVSLGANESVEFELFPVLYPGMTSVQGELVTEVGAAVSRKQVNVSLPQGKEIYLGFGGSWFGAGDSGQACTNQSPLRKPLGRKPRDAGPPDFWSKEGVGGLYESSTSSGMAVGQGLQKFAGARYLNIPMMALGQLFKGVAGKLKKDPPDPNFTELVRPVLRTAPTYSADPAQGLTAEAAGALNLLMSNGYLMVDISMAAAATLDKLGGATAAADAVWMDKQESLLRSYSQMLVGLTRRQSELLNDFIQVLPDNISSLPSAEQIQQAQTDLAANGFTSDQLADFAQAGLTAGDINELKAAILAADPEAVSQLGWSDFVSQLWSGDDVVTQPDLGRVFELSATASAHTRVPAAYLVTRFELPGGACPIGPHTTTLLLNEKPLLTLEDTVPEGLFVAAVDPALIRFFGPLPSGNVFGVDTENLNTGNYIRQQDTTLMVDLPLHGELVVASSQAEADQFVSSGGTTNHAHPNLVLASHPLASVDRALLSESSQVPLSFRVWNLGAAASSATSLGVFAEDPRLEQVTTSLVAQVPVAAIPPNGFMDLSVTVPGGLFLDQSTSRHVFWVPQPDDFNPDDNVLAINNPAACGP